MPYKLPFAQEESSFLDESQYRSIISDVEPHRLQELIYQDLSVYPESQIGDIHTRIGKEIAQRKLKTELDKMVENGKLAKSGEKRWTKYSINKSL